MEFLEGGRLNDGVHKKYTQVITLTKIQHKYRHSAKHATIPTLKIFCTTSDTPSTQIYRPPSSCLSAGTETLPTNQCCQEHKGVHAQLPLAIAKAGPGSTTQLSVQEQPYGISNTDCRINAEMWYDDTELVPNCSHKGAQSWTVPRWLFWS